LWTLALPAIAGSDLIVDALFGTGLSRPLEGRWASVIDDLNATGVPIVSVDVPSGVSGETGCMIGATIKATMTVTFGAPKIPLVMMPAALMAGEVVVVDIGVPQAIIDDVPGERLESITHEQASAWVETRRDDIHKGECGRVVIVAGSVGKAGAAQLAALGALRSGAGLVTVATPRSCLGVMLSKRSPGTSSMIACGTPMSTTTTSPAMSAAGIITSGIFGAPKVTVIVAFMVAPIMHPVSPETPDGTSTETIGTPVALRSSITLAQRPSRGRDNPVPKRASTIKSLPAIAGNASVHNS
jgi:hypothetical protein